MFYVMILINMIYVSAEFVFNFILLNTASTQVSLDDIHTVEILGRSLAAFGFTFIFWKIIQGKNIIVVKKIIIMMLVAAITYPAFYFAQEKAVNSLASNSSLETREKMNDLFLLKQGLINGALQLNSVPYNETIKDLPESKTFISNISLFMINNDTVQNYIKSNKEKIAAHVFAVEVQKNTSKYAEMYARFYKETDELYRNYDVLNEQRKVDVRKAGIITDSSYSDMEKKLRWMYRKEHDMSAYIGMSYEQYVNTPKLKQLIKDEVKKKHGIILTRNFNPANKDSLKAAMQGTVSDKYDSGNTAMKTKYGFTLPSNIESKDEFYANPNVKKMLREKLGNLYFDNVYGQYALRGMNDDDNTIIKNHSEEIGRGLAKEFLKKDLSSDEGSSLVKAMIVPPIALLLSLLFAFINFFILIKAVSEKFMYGRVSKPSRYSNIVVAVLILLLILLPTVLGNKYTESDSYQKVYKNMEEYNSVMAHGVNWIMKFEPFVYNYGETFIKK